MNTLIIEKTLSTPYINFDPATGLLLIRGESFPENAAKFYTPVVDWLKEYIASVEPVKEVTAEFEIVYFNSSTSKVFLTIFDFFEEAAEQGKKIKVNWCCDARNETAIECGQEFKEDIDVLPFQIIIINND
ncbi:MAG: DUF1987 domain-containing protein [Syntrophomonadaceae bacterium]|nr:DUF1987 domain-containing protein [Syntrophomonadaceae bacterium]